jgi:alpha-ketoglutarate-dependent taurine dioxygenase
MSIAFEPIKPLVGATVRVDRNVLCEKDFAQECLDLLEARGVLVFPRLGLTDAEQLAFTDRLAPRVNYSGDAPGGDAAMPDVYKVTLDPMINDHPEYVHGTFFWHMDGLVVDIPPPKAILLSARRLSSNGGQTEFASTFAAYENLSAAQKAEIASLRAVHSIEASLRPIVEQPTEEDRIRWSRISVIKKHPLVWSQRSARKSLIVGTTADCIVDMPLPEGRALLTRLLAWTVQADFHYRHEWQEGDLVVWNNCGTLHRVIPYGRDSGRTMHRTTVAGTECVN